MAVVIGTNAGFVNSAPVSNPLGSSVTADDRARTIVDTSPATATKITSIGMYVNNDTEDADVELGVYDDDGSGHPNNLLASVTLTKGTSAGWVSKAIDLTITSSTKYHIAVQIDNTSTTTTLGASSGGAANTGHSLTSQTSLPDPWGSTSGLTTIYAIYATWSAGSTGTNAQINIGDSWKTMTAAKINIGDTWKDVAGMQINIGDSWKTIF